MLQYFQLSGLPGRDRQKPAVFTELQKLVFDWLETDGQEDCCDLSEDRDGSLFCGIGRFVPEERKRGNGCSSGKADRFYI